MSADAKAPALNLSIPDCIPSSPQGSPTLHKALSPKGANPWDCSNWDLNTQQPHGGQEWSSLKNFVEDFSVTTNFMGPPSSALAAATGSLQHLHHYPAANFEPALSDLAKFLSPGDADSMRKRLLLGNGASELIDLVIRCGAHQGNFFVEQDQYKEYQRAALAAGRGQLGESTVADCSLVAIVNPCNPTGEYKNNVEMKAYLEEICSDHSTLLIDESMQPWVGPHWREESLIHEVAWVQSMLEKRDVRIYVIHSWTKIWCCPGLRIGSIVAPCEQDVLTLKEHQVPWSLNVCALAFLSAATKDDMFLDQTWELTPRWHRMTADKLRKMFPTWQFHCADYLSWLWIDTQDAKVAERAMSLAKAAGVPLRWGGLGYNKPTFIRIAVRSPKKQSILWKALAPLTNAAGGYPE
jgi:histidinol-phosphate/aromatic aminotransferase/cobyric acid decarboxylase-like protein